MRVVSAAHQLRASHQKRSSWESTNSLSTCSVILNEMEITMIKTGLLRVTFYLFLTLMGLSLLFYAAQAEVIKEDMK